MTNTIEPATPLPTRRALFSAFFKIGILGFGGVAAFARHVLVVERGYLSEREFAESFGLSSSLPGANTVNLAAMLGDRWRGPTGALAGVAGLVGAPLIVLLVLMALYAHFADLPDVRAGLTGAAAAAAGLIIGTSLKLMRSIEPDLVRILIFVGVCIASAVAHVPMPIILAVVLPLSLGLTFGLASRPA